MQTRTTDINDLFAREEQARVALAIHQEETIIESDKLVDRHREIKNQFNQATQNNAMLRFQLYAERLRKEMNKLAENEVKQAASDVLDLCHQLARDPNENMQKLTDLWKTCHGRLR